jgi:hypothetical protein
MSPYANIVIRCEPGRDFVPVASSPWLRPDESEVVAALSALPSVGRSRARGVSRSARAVGWGVAGLIALVGSLSTVALGYVVYALFVPVH